MFNSLHVKLIKYKPIFAVETKYGHDKGAYRTHEPSQAQTVQFFQLQYISAI